MFSLSSILCFLYFLFVFFFLNLSQCLSLFHYSCILSVFLLFSFILSPFFPLCFVAFVHSILPFFLSFLFLYIKLYLSSFIYSLSHSYFFSFFFLPHSLSRTFILSRFIFLVFLCFSLFCLLLNFSLLLPYSSSFRYLIPY